MKKIVVIGVALVAFFSCSDGDLEIETLDFDSTSIQDCGDIEPTTTNILFKINGDEALILELQSGVLNNGNSTTDTTETTSTIPSQSKLIYRVFSENVTSSYFCGEFPPASPTVLEEIEAEDGSVIVKSIAVNDSTEYSHTIELSGISLVNTSGERITDLSINEFGEINTTISN